MNPSPTTNATTNPSLTTSPARCTSGRTTDGRPDPAEAQGSCADAGQGRQHLRALHPARCSCSLESGADDTEALSRGRWDHLSRLTEASTRVEVTETTRCDATPGHHRRQTAQTVRTLAPHGQAPAEAGASRSVDQ